ncbi:MAG: hypothetical protein ACKV0T_08150 [Planctomycetales bacterium]
MRIASRLPRRLFVGLALVLALARAAHAEILIQTQELEDATIAFQPFGSNASYLADLAFTATFDTTEGSQAEGGALFPLHTLTVAITPYFNGLNATIAPEPTIFNADPAGLYSFLRKIGTNGDTLYGVGLVHGQILLSKGGIAQGPSGFISYFEVSTPPGFDPYHPVPTEFSKLAFSEAETPFQLFPLELTNSLGIQQASPLTILEVDPNASRTRGHLVAAVPEPSLLLMASAGGLVAIRLRRRRPLR